MKTEKNYKAYIAANEFSQSFDNVMGSTTKNAISAIKRRNSPDWKDCCVWVVFVHPSGDEEKIYYNNY